jgi:hypothetical protein
MYSQFQYQCLTDVIFSSISFIIWFTLARFTDMLNQPILILIYGQRQCAIILIQPGKLHIAYFGVRTRDLKYFHDSMVPTLAVGFDDVRKRMEGQYRTCAVFKERLEVSTSVRKQNGGG